MDRLMRLALALLLALAGTVPARAVDQILPAGRVTTSGDILFGAIKFGRRIGGRTTLAPDAIELTGPNAYAATPPILSGDATGAGIVTNGIWESAAFFHRMHNGPDFGNTTPVAFQSGIRCTTVSDYRVYEACRNIDFYARTGYIAPWTASTAYALGAKARRGDNVYVATQAGTSAASGGPSGTGSGISDGTVVWNYEANYFTSAKVGWSFSTMAYAGAGKTWGLNPNCIFNSGFRSEGYCMEIDVSSYTGRDCVIGDSIPCIEGIWLGGLYQNTMLGGMTIGGFPTAGKPMFLYAYWCKNAMAAGEACYEDWSNAKYSLHTPTFATKTSDLFLQSSGQSALNASGSYSVAAVDLRGATIQPSAHAVMLKAGQDVCLNGGNACMYYEAGRLKYKVNGEVKFSVDDNGNAIFRGAVSQNGNP